MKINITVDESNYFHKLLILLNDIPPFSNIRPRELELYSHILNYYHAHSRVPLNEINRLVFCADFREELADKIGIDVSGVYNLMKGLRQAGIVEKDKLKPEFIIPKQKSLTFNFVSTE